MKVHTVKQITNALLLAAFLSACGTKPTQTDAPEQDANALSQQSVNAVIWYATSAENAYIFEQTYRIAEDKVRQRLNQHLTYTAPAVVLDIDETVLDNSPYMLNLIKKGETFSEESWEKWVRMASARPLPGVLSFLNTCKELGVEVFFISNRSAKYLEFTVNNLIEVGIPTDLDHVLLKESDSDKTARREQIIVSYDVLLYIGDNLRDFDEMFKDRSTNGGRETVRKSKDEMLDRHLLLPNPMYGQWERIFKFPAGTTDAEKAEAKIQQTHLNDY